MTALVLSWPLRDGRAIVKRAGGPFPHRRPHRPPHTCALGHSLLRRRDSVAGACGPTTAPVTPNRGGMLRGLDDSEFRACFGLGPSSGGKRDWLAVHISQPHPASANSLTFSTTGNGRHENRATVSRAKKQPPAISVMQPSSLRRMMKISSGVGTIIYNVMRGIHTYTYMVHM